MINTTKIMTTADVIVGLTMKKKFFDQVAPSSEQILEQADLTFNLLGYVEVYEKASFGPSKYFVFQSDFGLMVKLFATNSLVRRFKDVNVPQIFLS